MVIVGVDDLLFQSRIRAAAQAIGAPIRFARQREALMTAVREDRPSLLILDLDCQAIDPLGVIREIRSDPALTTLPLVAYASHTHADLLQAARDAGCDRVLARSRFVAVLPALIDSVRGPSHA